MKQILNLQTFLLLAVWRSNLKKYCTHPVTFRCLYHCCNLSLDHAHHQQYVQFPRRAKNSAILSRYQDCSFSLAFAFINCLCCWICFCKKLNDSSWASSSAPWSSSCFVLNSGSDNPVFRSGQGGATDDFLMGGIGALLLRAAWLANAASWACWATEGRPDTLWLLQYAAAFVFSCGV